MRYALRTIAYACELLHLPVPPEPRALQKVHNRMFESGDPPYRNFAVHREGVVLSNPTSQPQAVSSVSFLRDRIQFREELTGLTTEEFVRRVEGTSAQACPARDVQIFTAQVVTVRTLVNPKHFKDSREFLRQGVFGFGAELGDFGREAQLFGLRLVFPPGEKAPNAFTLRIESYAGDSRSLYLENQGSFGPVLLNRGLEALGANIEATYRFIVDRVLAFLGHFDARTEA
jgi:hypothetical protein